MSTTAHRNREMARYYLQGTLSTDTALHIGSGYGNAATDAAVVRDLQDHPYIPGSSFKGVLRSTIERTLGSLPKASVTTCQLTPGVSNCLTTDATRQKAYSRVQEQFVVHQDEMQLLTFLKGQLGICDLCWLFGSPVNQSRFYVSDLPLLSADDNTGGAGEVQAGEIRHGVGIDRITLTARDRIKFDYEVLPSQLSFRVEILLDRPSPLDWALLALGLQEMRLGFVPLGGLRSRGLGRATLNLQQIHRIALDDKAALIDFLCQAQPTAAGGIMLPEHTALNPVATVLDHLAKLKSWL